MLKAAISWMNDVRFKWFYVSSFSLSLCKPLQPFVYFLHFGLVFQIIIIYNVEFWWFHKQVATFYSKSLSKRFPATLYCFLNSWRDYCKRPKSVISGNLSKNGYVWATQGTTSSDLKTKVWLLSWSLHRIFLT